MITIQVLGLDQFVVGRYSRENSGNLAQAFECSEDDISFYAPNAMMFHNGVEQTSWSILVKVLAPKKYAAVEKTVADVLLKSISFFSINVEVIFEYYDEVHRYAYVNDQYPRFITTDEIRDDGANMTFGEVPEAMEGEEEEDECDEEGCDCGHEHHHPEPGEGEGEIFLGNAFEGFEEALDDAHKNHDN